MAGKPKVVGGVDTHADTMHLAVMTLLGRKLADREFRTDARGYWEAIRFMRPDPAACRPLVSRARALMGLA
jgi:hypothetical protein